MTDISHKYTTDTSNIKDNNSSNNNNSKPNARKKIAAINTLAVPVVLYSYEAIGN